MKKIIFISCLIIHLISFSQVTPPSNVIVSINTISGNGDFRTAIKVDTNVDGIAEHTIIVNYEGYFTFNFTPALATAQNISIWSEDATGAASVTVTMPALSSDQILTSIASGSARLPDRTATTTAVASTPPQKVNPQLYDKQPASTTFSYKTTIINTNFTVPIARFNFTKHSDETPENDSKVGDILLFNSIGCGIGISWGELTRTTNDKSEVINTEFVNSIGIHLGVLFSAGSGTDPKNVFAPTLSLSMLDFQIGIGYELGTVAEGLKKQFVTVAYAIPLSKLIKGKYYVLYGSKGYNDTNSLDASKDEFKKEKILGYK